MGRQGGEGKPAMQPAGRTDQSTATLALDTLAGCWQGELTLCAKEKRNKGLCRSLSQCLLSCYGHKGKSLKPPQLCSSASHGSRATTEPTGKPPYHSSPRHKPASPQRSSAGRAQAVRALRLPCSRSPPHSSQRAATASHMEHVQQTFLHTLCHGTSWSQASLVQHQQHILQQTSAHANHAEFVPVLSTSAQEGGPHISETILSIFQAIAPDQTPAVCPGSNSSRVKSCKFSNVRGALIFLLPLMRQHEPRLTVTALCHV